MHRCRAGVVIATRSGNAQQVEVALSAPTRDLLHHSTDLAQPSSR